MVKLNAFRDMYSEDEIRRILGESDTDFTNDIDFEIFLKVSGLVPSILSFLLLLDYELFSKYWSWNSGMMSELVVLM